MTSQQKLCSTTYWCQTILVAFSFLLLVPSGLAKSKAFLKTGDHKKLHGKSGGLFQVQFQSQENSDGNMEISATVHSHKDTPGAHIKWTLPSHWKLITGDLESNQNFSQSENFNQKITVDRNTLHSGDQAFLFVYTMKDGEKHGISASYVHKKTDEDNAAIQMKSQSPMKKPRKVFE